MALTSIQRMIIQKVSNKTIEICLSAFSLSLSSFIAIYVYGLGYTRIIVDQNSHLNLTRQVIDSLTPGISQLGFWPPLLHIVMIPFVSVDYLYRSGLAGYLSLVTFYLISGIVIFRTVLYLTNNRYFGIISSVVFIMNPYVLYYTVTPMMEVLYLSMLCIVVYFFIRAQTEERIRYSILCAIFVSLASLARYEGVMLVPIIFILLLISMLMKKKGRYQIEAFIILFFSIASLGVLFTLIYGLIYNNSPLAFINNKFAAYFQQRDYILPTEHNVLLALKYMLHAGQHLLSTPLVLLSLACSPLFLFLPRKRFLIFSSSILLLTPFMFDYLALVRGNAVLYVPELPPYGIFFNERYALYSICYIALIPLVSIVLLSEDRFRNMKITRYFFLGIISIAVLFNSIYFFYKVVFIEKYKVISETARTYPSKEQSEAASVLKSKYDFGKVLITRALHDYVAVESGIPIKSLIHESNHKYYDQAIERPWLFARWVVMFNSSGNDPTKWSSLNERVSKQWGSGRNKQTFLKYYTLIFENKREQIYKVRDESILEYSISRGYDIEKIPSVNIQITTWDPDNIYKDMKISKTDLRKYLNQRVDLIDIYIQRNISQIYDIYLKPTYTKGYNIDQHMRGTSEGQSYIMLHALFNNDIDTFKKAWAWTKNNIQRTDNMLFAWEFEYEPRKNEVKILDKNSATDADTDIAYSLLLAGEKWNDEILKREGEKIVASIWDNETALIRGKRHITAGNWAENKDAVIINPSYFSPYAYSLFSKYDNKHNWKELTQSMYTELIQGKYQTDLNQNKHEPPPNWITYNKVKSIYEKYAGKPDANDHSYDAFRIYWRIAYDYRISNSPLAKEYFNSVAIFYNSDITNKFFCTVYNRKEELTCNNSENINSSALVLLSIIKPDLMDSYILRTYIGDDGLKIDTNGYLMNWDMFTFYYIVMTQSL